MILLSTIFPLAVVSTPRSGVLSMKPLRIGVPVLAGLVAIGGWLLAQDPKKDPDKDPTIRVRGTLPPHFKSLGLTDDQKQNVYKLRNRYTAKIDALKQQIHDLQEEEKDALEKLLTEGQKARLRELKLGETAPKPPTTEKKPDPDKKPDADKKPDGK
jgi:hypothetical protein